MKELRQLGDALCRLLEGCGGAMVKKGYGAQEGPAPLRRPLITVELEQVKLGSMGLGEGSRPDGARMRQAQAVYRLELFAPDGSGCLELLEEAAQKLCFDQREIAVLEVTGGSLRERGVLGGVSASAQVVCRFGIRQEDAPPLWQAEAVALTARLSPPAGEKEGEE